MQPAAENSPIVTHACLMAISWSLLVVPMAIFARYYRHRSTKWFSMHWLLNVLALILVSSAFVIIVLESGNLGGSIHSVLGVIVMVLAILQGVLGQISHQSWFEGKPSTFWPDKIHWYVGRLLILLALINIILGLEKFGASAAPYGLYGIYLVLTVAYVIFLELKFVRGGDYERINDDQERGNQGVPLKYFWFYWAISTILISVALGLNFG